MTFPAITGDNQTTLQDGQLYWSRAGEWIKHEGVYQVQEFYNGTSSGSRFTFADYPYLPRPINYIEIRGAFQNGTSPSQRFFFDMTTVNAGYTLYYTAHSEDFQGAMYRGGDMWGQNTWRNNFAFESNGFPLNWGDGGWPVQANTPTVADIKIHVVDGTWSTLTWTCTFVNSGNVAVVKGHGKVKMTPADFMNATFWLTGSHAGGSICVRYS